MVRLEAMVQFTKDTGNKNIGEHLLEVDQDMVKLKIRQTGTINVVFRGEQDEIEGVMGFFETLTDMEPLAMNIAAAGDKKVYFKGIAPVKEEADDIGNKIYTYEVSLQEI